jgi:arylformamidase
LETDPFRIRGHVAEFDVIVNEIIDASAKARRRLPAVLDVAYGDDPSETLDIFYPDLVHRDLPVHMFIHGGYWRMFSKRDYSYVADTVTASGAIAVIIDYALMPSVRLNVIVDQIRRAKQWLSSNITAYGGDPTRLSISGHSAGAHLATFLFERREIERRESQSKIAAALLLGGVYDLKPLQASFLQPEIGLTDQEVVELSPLRLIHRSDCRVVVAVGAEETEPFHRQADDFAVSLGRQGLSVRTRSIENCNHMSSVRDLGVSGTPTAAILVEVLRSV